MCDITYVTLSLPLYILHHLMSSTAIVMYYISLDSHFQALFISTAIIAQVVAVNLFTFKHPEQVLTSGVPGHVTLC